MNNPESANNNMPSTEGGENTDTVLNQVREQSHGGGAHTKAQQIATALYGGHPPAAYVDQIGQGLDGEDR